MTTRKSESVVDELIAGNKKKLDRLIDGLFAFNQMLPNTAELTRLPVEVCKTSSTTSTLVTLTLAPLNIIEHITRQLY
jgi:hypothetical protein